MDQKKIKELLKIAHSSVMNKQFEEAVKHSQEILTLDENNYKALVFLGAALEGQHQYQKAFDSYKKASKIDAKQPLAWQGICSLYEKHAASLNIPKTAFVEAYENLDNLLTSNDRKRFENGLKLGQLYLDLNDLSKLATNSIRLMSLPVWSEIDETLALPLWRLMASALPKVDPKSDENFTLFLNASKSIIDSSFATLDDRRTSWLNYIESCVMNGCDSHMIWNSCLESLIQFPESNLQKEILCQIYIDNYPKYSFDDVESIICGMEDENAFKKLAEGHRKLLESDLTSARSTLENAIAAKKESITGSILLSQCLERMHCYKEAHDIASKAIKLLDSNAGSFFGDRNSARQQLRLCLVRICLSGQDAASWQRSIDICRELETISGRCSVDAKLYSAFAKLKLGLNADVKLIIDDLNGVEKDESLFLVLKSRFHQEEKEMEEAKNCLQRAVELNDVSARVHHELGLFYWQLIKTDASNEACKELCLRHFIQSVKLDPYMAESFVYLGHYYSKIASDISKARRCYQKACELDKENFEAGSGLVDCLMALGEQDTALQQLKVITERNKQNSPKWAWLRLGLYHMKYGNPTDAIVSFQEAVRKDPKDVHCWECLGEAFMNRGSYNSALKVFAKVTELDPAAFYSYYQVSTIKLKLGQYTDAIEQFNWIIERLPQYVPALQGLGEACVQLARSNLARFLHCRAAINCQMAIDHLTRAAKIRPDFSCIWKLLGDAFTMLHQVPDNLLSLTVPQELLNDSISLQEKNSLISKKDLLEIGARCYGMALKQRSDLASLWHDLGINYYYQLKVTDGPLLKVTAIKSFQALQKSVTLDPSNHVHWNALGIVAADRVISDPAVAQHCFIMSIKVESNNVVAWANLGTLYLINDQVELAHEAFKVAQSLEPSYVASWIGQAFIAENIGDVDTMDLFRHALELGDHVESCIGYAYWVCSTIQDKTKMSSKWHQYAIEHLNAISTASDALEKYTVVKRDDAIGWNLFGVLLERKGLNGRAVEAFSRSVEILESSPTNEGQLRSVRENLARLLWKTQNFAKSIEQFKKLHQGSHPSFDSQCGLAVALFGAGRYEECLNAYEAALELTSNKDDKSMVNVAMGMAAFSAKDYSIAKTHFLNIVSSNCTPSEVGLGVLLSFALVQRDSSLISAVLKELAKLKSADCLKPNLVYLKACVKLMQGDAKRATGELLREIHRHPDVVAHWSNLSLFLLSYEPERLDGAYTSSRVALSHDITNHQIGLQHISLSSLKSSNHQRSFRAAQKSVHLFPDQISNWCLLLAASHCENVDRISTNKSHLDLQSFTLFYSKHLMSQVESDLSRGDRNKSHLQNLHHWIVRQYVLALFVANRLEPAAAFLQQATWLYEEDNVLIGLLAYLKKDKQTIEDLANSDSTTNSTLILFMLLLVQNLTDAAQALYHKDLLQSRLFTSNVLVRSSLEKYLLQVHLKTGNTKSAQEMVAMAEKEKNEELLQFYQMTKDSK